MSLRCHPQLSETRSAISLTLPLALGIQPGPACLLCHKHNEQLWDLKSFLLRGTLAREGDGWLFRPEQFIPGVGIGGPLSYLRFLVNGRRTTRRYLKKRGLVRPKIPWHEWQEMFSANGQEMAELVAGEATSH